MSLKDQFRGAAIVIKGAAALLALLPSIANLIGLVSIPPSIKNLDSFISFFLGLASVLGTVLLSEKIARIKSAVVSVIVLILAVIGAGAATEYYLVASKYVITINHYDKPELVIIPINPSPDINKIIALYDGDFVEALQTSSLKIELIDLINKENGSTIIILVIFLVIAQSASISAIVIGAWRLAT